MKKKNLIAPSILSADFSRMGEGVEKINRSGADWVHVDVMDGTFVPVITFGEKMVRDIRPLTDLPLDVHLMTEHPETFIDPMAKAGADYLTFHIEAVLHAHRIVQQIKDLGCKAGISLVPSTPVALLSELLPYLDHILVMTVNPGFGGQSLIPECLDKVAELRNLREEKGYTYTIAADGGINKETFPGAFEACVDVFITGSAFFKDDDPEAFVHSLQNYNG